MTTTIFSTSFRLLACDHCGAPIQAEQLGGRVQCRYCGAAHSIAARDDRSLTPTAPRAPMSEHDRLARLRAQDGRPFVPSAALAGLLEHGELPAWKVEEALAMWQATRREARGHQGTDAGERLVHLTLMLSNTFVRSATTEPARHRAMVEAALDAVHLARHRQVLRGLLSRAACRDGDLEAAKAWLAPCDRCSDDLETDSSWRVARAYLDTAQANYGEVLAVLGLSPEEVPIADTLDPLATLLRANACERLGNAPFAARLLEVDMAAGPGRQVILAELRAEHGQLALCPGTFPTTSAARAEQMACDAAEAADGVTPTKVWASTGCLFLFALVPLGIAIIDMIEAGTMDLNHGGVWVSGLLCAALIILVIVLWRGYRNPSSDRNIAKRLMLGGLPARARVASITTSGSPEDARHMVHLDLEVAPRDRAPYRARTKVFASPSEQAELQVGASVAVRFDPEEPTQVALEPLVRRVLVRPSA